MILNLFKKKKKKINEIYSFYKLYELHQMEDDFYHRARIICIAGAKILFFILATIVVAMCAVFLINYFK